MNWLFLHLPHLLPPALAFMSLARLAVWASEQPPSHFTDEEVEEWNREQTAKRAERHRPVLPPVARLGLLALAPLIACIATGLFIYTFNLRGDRPSALLVWSHTALAAAALALVTWKAAAIGWPRIRSGLSLRSPFQALSSLLLLGLGLPLLATGAVLLLRPSGSSFTDYAHLIVSVWWTVLLQWHLYRYFGRALGATFRGTGAAPRSQPAGD